MNDASINIRSIQHYMYCPRRFALLEINKDWSENAFVVKANLLHEHVHDGSHGFSDSKKIVKSSIAIFNDLPEYDLYGIADCLEFIRDDNGITVAGQTGKYKVKIIEYKPTAPKGELFYETDAIQVFAQKVCVDYVWKCNSEAFIYYSDVRKRVPLPFDTEYERYNQILKTLLLEMRKVLDRHEIPARRKGQKCCGCSISDLCFPTKKKYCVREIVNAMKGGE